MNGTVSTIAGSFAGYQDGTCKMARFNCPAFVAVAADGSVLVSDSNNHCIRRVSPGNNRSLLKLFSDTAVRLLEREYNCWKRISRLLRNAFFIYLQLVTLQQVTLMDRFHDRDFTVQEEYLLQAMELFLLLTGKDSNPKLAFNILCQPTNRENNCIRRIVPKGDSFEISTWTGKKKWGFKNGALEDAEFNLPQTVCIDESGFHLLMEYFICLLNSRKSICCRFRQPLH